MKNGFDTRIKKIQDELLALKTAAEYSSIRNIFLSPTIMVTTGLYRITYNSNGQTIMSEFYRRDGDTPCQLFGRTPSGSTQVVEVNTTSWSNEEQRYITYENGLIISSNVPVTNITRI